MTAPSGGTNCLICLVTTPTEKAACIARALVEQRLVACANVVPLVQSIFWWNGSVQEEQESVLILKTTKTKLPDLNEALRAMHPYEIFELVALDINDGNGAYLDWISQCVASLNSDDTSA